MDGRRWRSRPRDSGPNPMAIPATYSMSRMQRSPPSLPFGWGAVTVLLVGALFTIIGIVIIIYAAFGFITGTIGAALGGGGVLGIFSSMMGAIILFVIGGVLAGEKMEDALRVAGDANARGMDALVNHLGEHYREKGPVEATTREYLGLLNAMRAQGIRGTVSLKPTQFGVLIDRAYALSQMLPVLDATKADGRVLWLDMENAHTTDDTLWIGERLLERYDRIGVCLQANLRRTGGDLDRLIASRARIRLVKGA